jgi:hypothetical protein
MVAAVLHLFFVSCPNDLFLLCSIYPFIYTYMHAPIYVYVPFRGVPFLRYRVPSSICAVLAYMINCISTPSSIVLICILDCNVGVSSMPVLYSRSSLDFECALPSFPIAQGHGVLAHSVWNLAICVWFKYLGC